MNYIERKKALAKALDVDQEDCRSHDKTNLWGYRLDRNREVCVIAPDVESAAAAIRQKVEELR